MKCYCPSSACYCCTKVAVRPTSIVFSTQEFSVGKAAVTEIQYQLKGHLVLFEVEMSVGQPAASPSSLALCLGRGRGWGWGVGLLRLLWGLIFSSALPSWRWVIFKTQCVCLCIYRFLLALSMSLNPSR